MSDKFKNASSLALALLGLPALVGVVMLLAFITNGTETATAAEPAAVESVESIDRYLVRRLQATAPDAVVLEGRQSHTVSAVDYLTERHGVTRLCTLVDDHRRLALDCQVIDADTYTRLAERAGS